MNTGGQINFTLGLDDSELQQKAERDAEIFGKVGDVAVSAGQRIDKSFEQSGNTAEEMGRRIDTSFEQLGSKADTLGKAVADSFQQQAMSARELSETIETQNRVVSQLRDQYEKAKQAADEAFGGDASKYQELIAEQEKLKEEYDKETDALRRLNQQREAMDTSGDAEQSLRMKLRMVTQELASLTLKYREMSAEEKASAQGQELKRKIDELIKKAGTLRDAMDDANRAIRGAASDTQNFDALAQGLNVVTSTAGAAQGALSMLGMNEEALMEIQTKLQASLAISNALSVIQNNLQKESALMLGVRRIQENATAAAIAIRTAAEGKGVIVTKAATVTQAAFNAVAKANPYVLLATVILGVGAAFLGFSKKVKEAKDIEEKQREELEKQQKAAEEWRKTISDNAAQVATQYRLLQEQYKKLKTEHEKKKWVDENKSSFSKLGVAVNNVTDAEKVFVQNTAKMMDAFKKRAEAAAYQTKLTEAYSRLIDRRRQLDEERETLGKGGNVRQSGAKIEGEDVSRYGLKEGVDYTHKKGQVGMFYTDAGAAKVNRGIQERRTEDNDPEIRKINAEINGYVNKITSLQGEVNGIMDSLSLSTAKSIDKNVDKNAKKLAETMERAKEAYSKALQEAHIAREDAEVKATEDEGERTIKQLTLNHIRALAEIEREKSELVAKKRDVEGKDATLSPEELKIFEDRRDYENKIFQAALEKRSKDAADKEKADMEEYLITYGTYQERINAIHERYATLRQNAETEGSRLSLAAQEEVEIEQLNEKFGYATQAMADLFADAGRKSVKEIQRIIDKYEMLIKFMQGQKAEAQGGKNTSNITTNDLKGAGFSERDIKSIKDGKVNIKDLTDALKQLKGDLGERSPWLTFQKDVKDSVNQLKKGDLSGGISNMGNAITKFTPQVQALGEQIGSAFGFDSQDANDVMQIIGGIGQGAQAAGQMMSGDFVGGAMSAVSAISSIGSAITNLIDRKHEKRIQALQREIDALESSYGDLERAANHSYSFIKQKNIGLEIENKQHQIELITEQINEERDKKKTDDNRVREWEQKIRDLRYDIEDLRLATADAIFGESIETAIENFSSAYAEAWANSEDKALSAKDTIKKMMKSMVMESIKSAIQAGGAMERIRSKLQSFFADNVLSDWEQNYVLGMAESLQSQLDYQFGWAENLFKKEEEEPTTQDSSRGGFETMSQEMGSELSGRFTGIQIETGNINKKLDIVIEDRKAIHVGIDTMVEGIDQMVELQGTAVSHLASIERNTRPLPEMGELLEKIEKNTRKL